MDRRVCPKTLVQKTLWNVKNLTRYSIRVGDGVPGIVVCPECVPS